MSGDYHGGYSYVANALNSANQVPAFFWNHMHDRHRDGGPMGLMPGDYNLRYGYDSLPTTTGVRVGTEDIDAIWVPPNMQVVADGCDGRSCDYGFKVTYLGDQSSTGYTGQYWPVPPPMGINRIGTLNIRYIDDLDETDPDRAARVEYPWKRVLQKCCTGNFQGCGTDYQPGGPGCAAQFDTCSGADLISDGALLPSYQKQYCQKQCRGDMQKCDLIKKSYCADNPLDPWCACMIMDQTNEYREWLKSFTAKYPSIPASRLMYRGVDGANVCRDNLSTDLTEMLIPYELTKSIGYLPDSYSIVDLTISGSNNNLSNVNLTQGGVTTDAAIMANQQAAAGDGQFVTSTGEYSDAQIFFMVLLVIICVFCGILYAVRYIIRNTIESMQKQPVLSPKAKRKGKNRI
jgi:hypothetical protein